MSPKKELRLFWKKKLEEISPTRRKEAEQKVATYPINATVIASFSSFGNEINTQPLNERLSQNKTLALPRVEHEHLVFYAVQDLKRELIPSSLGILEPNPALCPRISKIDIILVPALAFDKENHRLGFGKGYYDRFLSKNPIPSIGIGFKEQLTEALPHEKHDIPLHEVLFF